MHGRNLHCPGVVAAATCGKRSNRLDQKSKVLHLAPPNGAAFSLIRRAITHSFSFSREFMGVLRHKFTDNSTAKERLNVIFWGDFCIKVKLAARAVIFHCGRSPYCCVGLTVHAFFAYILTQ